MENLAADALSLRDRHETAAFSNAQTLGQYETLDAAPPGPSGIDPGADQYALMAARQSLDLGAAQRAPAARLASTPAAGNATGAVAINLNDNLGVLTPAQQRVVGFESGAKPDLTPANPSFFTYIYNQPQIYSTQATLQTGATITYEFQPGSYTAGQKADIQQAMAAWSGVCNVTWVEVYGPAASPLLTISNQNSNPAGEYQDLTAYRPTAQPNVYQMTQEVVVTALATGVGIPGDYATGGFGQSSMVHELGHALGLGHTGYYNGVDPVTAGQHQLNAYDSRAWSLMSYVDPADKNALYYAQSATPNADYNVNAGIGPMGLDIYAVQRLYGAPTSRMFSGGQVFGFDSNITYTTSNGNTAIMETYDFSVDTHPIVTLYDYGTGNTLNLSGFSSNDTVNLNAGAFSSANGYVDNIFIEYGTAIDSFVAGSGNDTITVNAQADTITGTTGQDTVVFGHKRADYTLTRSGNVIDVTGFGVTDTLTNITTLQFSDGSVAASTIQCYSRGTRIETPMGDIEIESLSVGDPVLTASGAVLPIRWIGTRQFDPRFIGRNPRILPIRICRDALADGVPRRDLLVFPEHAMLIDGVLVAAKNLVNGASIRQEEPGAIVEYFHIELDTHDVVAEGAASETYVEDGDRGMFRNAAERSAVRPTQPARYCAERVEDGERLDAIRARLDARAGVRAIVTADPAVHLRADGAIILPAVGLDGAFDFSLPAAARDLVLVSRHTTGTGTDRRGLGIAVATVTIDGQPLALATLPDRGWHELERDGARCWRWTDGAAQLPPAAHPCRITIEVRGTQHYRRFAQAA